METLSFYSELSPVLNAGDMAMNNTGTDGFPAPMESLEGG